MHLNFSPFDNCAIQFLTCSVGVRTILERNKAEALHAWGKNKQDREKHASLLIIIVDFFNFFFICLSIKFQEKKHAM